MENSAEKRVFLLSVTRRSGFLRIFGGLAFVLEVFRIGGNEWGGNARERASFSALLVLLGFFLSFRVLNLWVIRMYLGCCLIG